MSLPDSTDILIVGAGPTGLALAIALRSLGVEPLVVDKQPAGANTSRAIVVHARTLEVLESLGVVGEFLAAGLQVQHFCVREGERALLTIDFATLPTAYRFALMCPQDRTEAILLERLHGLGGSVRRPAEVMTIRPGLDGADVDIVEDGQCRSLRAKWVIGCDGGHSTVRLRGGIAWDGSPDDETYVIADLRMHWPLGRDEVSLMLSPDGILAVAPLPGDRFRVVANLPQVPEPLQQSDLRTILERRGPAGATDGLGDIAWSSQFTIQHRVAATVRAGRVLLCGDAAHLYSPAGGQGMNTGIQDAVSLAGPLAHAVAAGETAGIKAWAADRHRVGADTAVFTERLSKSASTSTEPMRRLRAAALGAAAHFPFIRQALARKLAELG